MKIFFNCQSGDLLNNFNPTSINNITELLKKNLNKQICLEIDTVDIRSKAQNSYFHGPMLEYFEKKGIPRLSAKEQLKAHFIPLFMETTIATLGEGEKVILMNTKKYGWTDLHTSLLSVKEMARLLTEILNFYMDQGEPIPVPEDMREYLK